MASKSLLFILSIGLLLGLMCLEFTTADWLDDLNDGTNRLLATVNENGAKIDAISKNVYKIGHILRQLDPDSNEEE